MTPPPGKAGPLASRTVVLLGAFCLFLSTLEYLIPKPLPMIRIGLANLPLLLALDLLSPRYFSLLVLIKITGAGIVGGTIFSYVFVFSLFGSLASALVMYSLRRLSAGSLLSLTGIGVAGAMCSSGVQLFLARFLVFGEGVRYLVPPFLGLSLLTGCTLGLFCEQFCRRSRWYQKALSPAKIFAGATKFENGANFGEEISTERHGAPVSRTSKNRRERRRELRRELRRSCWDRRFNDPELIIAGFIALLLFLFNSSTLGRFLQFLFFWLCAWFSGRSNKPLITVSIIAGVVLVNLLVPYGRVLAELGPLHITAGSLIDGFRKGVTLEGLVMLSAVVIRGKPFPGVPALPAGGRGTVGIFRLAIFRRGAVFGRFLGESLSIFAVLRENRRRIRPGHFIDDVDALLLEMDGAPLPAATPAGEQHSDQETSQEKLKSGHVPANGRRWLVLGLLITAILTALPLWARLSGAPSVFHVKLFGEHQDAWLSAFVPAVKLQHTVL
ncbi:MAG: Gx transporter family protein [Treponema sp.]|nr:Gx transporter family protein [Treponema sp.]